MKKERLKIIPLGGLEEIGMNITAFEYGDSIIVVDCGLSFPTEDMLGIDLVIPDVSYLVDNIDKVKGFFITHGHEDHIGALPYVLRQVPVNVYGTRLSIGLIERKLTENPVPAACRRKIVKYGQSVQAGDFRVEFIKVNHSIVDAAALAIFTPVGTVIHTGDFKVDYTPVFGDTVDLQRFAELGKKGVLAMLCDSTNIFREGFTMSERTVGNTMDHIFSSHQTSRIIVATFASNVDRVRQIINTAYKYGRKVVVEGRSMVNIIGTAQELGYIDIPDDCLIDIEQLRSYPKEKTVLITTGSQGESMAALSRMASNIHRKVSIEPGDTIIMSSTPIPGNERAVSKVMNELSLLGANVIFQDTHVSGHACQEEIKLMYSLVKPRFAVPVHGAYRHRQAQALMIREMGWTSENTFVLSTGDVLELDGEEAAVTGKVHAGKVMVDGLGVGDVGNIVLRDRQTLAQHGIIIVTAVLESGTSEIISGPEIITRGFVYVKESEDLIEDCRNVVLDTFDNCRYRNIFDRAKIRSSIREELSDFLWKRMKRDPMILPILMDA